MTQQEISAFNQLLNLFNRFSEDGINETTEKWILSVLDNSLPLFTHLIYSYQFDKIERITINKRVLDSNKRIRNIKYLKYPPSENVTKYGRCNLPKQSVFYGSTIFMTAMDEMKPRVGDLITKSIWKLNEPKKLKFCPIFHVQPTNGTVNPSSINLENTFHRLVKENFPINQQEVVTNLSKFIAFQFSKSVHHKKNKDYLFSAYFSNKILNELDGGTINGIVYPSVQSNLSFDNIVLKTDVLDMNYHLSEVHESIVTKDPGDGGGGYLIMGINDCKEFEGDNILWNEKTHQPKELMEMYKKLYSIDLD